MTKAPVGKCERCRGECRVPEEGNEGETIDCPDCYGTGEAPDPDDVEPLLDPARAERKARENVQRAADLQRQQQDVSDYRSRS